MDVIIQTTKPACVLRRWRPADKPSLLSNANNRNVWRNLTDMFPHPYTKADAENWLQIATDDGRSVHLAIEYRDQAIGGIGAIAEDGIYRQTARLGYWLGEPHWGQGIATAAVTALLSYLDQAHSFARLQAAVFEWNPASMRVLEKCGFTREGVLRSSVTKDGHLIDCVMYARITGTGRSRVP